MKTFLSTLWGRPTVFVIASATLLMAGCAQPSKISATLDITRRSPDVVFVMLRIINLENRATTPLAPVVSVQTRTAKGWDQPVDEIKPAPFVLNKKEQRDIFKVLHTSADLVRATLTVREQESGYVLMTKRLEKAVPTSPQPVPSTAAPATPPPPGK